MADKTLAQRLREHAHEMTAYGMDPTAAMLTGAANEIERLQPAPRHRKGGGGHRYGPSSA